MIKIFKTDVQHTAVAEHIITDLLGKYPCSRINFDLEDEDKIMRVEGAFFATKDIILYLKSKGYRCVELPVDYLL